MLGGEEMIGPKGPPERSELSSRVGVNVTRIMQSKLPKMNAT